jgi:hypothetical protein
VGVWRVVEAGRSEKTPPPGAPVAFGHNATVGPCVEVWESPPGTRAEYVRQVVTNSRGAVLSGGDAEAPAYQRALTPGRSG